MRKGYTKGDKDTIVTRMNQVSAITLYAPTSDRSMDYLYEGLVTLCIHYYIDKTNEDLFLSIPAIDFYNVSLFVNKCCREHDVDSKYIHTMISIIKSFVNLKYISVKFVEDSDVVKSYEKVINIKENENGINIISELTNVYSIDAIEMYLGDMFDQQIIDLINKNLMFDEIIPNSYLERDFLIEFEFDEYISYINMFINNNKERLSMYDSNIMDYLRVFPTIIGDISKPIVKLYTNYSEV
jgi:hypothetical protein